jgi:hypothetical protein
MQEAVRLFGLSWGIYSPRYADVRSRATALLLDLLLASRRVISFVSSLLRDSAHVRQARSRCLPCCPRVAVKPLSRPPHRARGGHEPLRPELAAPLGVCPLPQLMEGVGGSSSSLLSGDVAVFCCCTGALGVSFGGAARCAVPTRRPSVFQAGHIPSWRRSCKRYAPSPIAAGSCWLLLLLSPLLSAAGPVPHLRGLPGAVTAPCPTQALPRTR